MVDIKEVFKLFLRASFYLGNNLYIKAIKTRMQQKYERLGAFVRKE
jgi:hypothetical protein